MDHEQQSARDNNLSRRKFMRDSAIAAAGLAVGLGTTGCQSTYSTADIKKTPSYNPNMEYRRLGKTGLWVSAVCLGGHWKRVDKMVPGLFKGGGWLGADLVGCSRRAEPLTGRQVGCTATLGEVG